MDITYGVIYWVTLAILWACIGANVWAILRGRRLNRYLEIERKYCTTMMAACIEFLDAEISRKIEKKGFESNETDAH